MRARVVGAAIVAALLGVVAARPATTIRKGPLRIRVAGPADGPAVFRAMTTGAGLWSAHADGHVVGPLAVGDTLRATGPVEFSADVARGGVVFTATGAGELQVTVWPAGRRALPVSARGRSLVVQQGRYGPEVVTR